MTRKNESQMKRKSGSQYSQMRGKTFDEKRVTTDEKTVTIYKEKKNSFKPGGKGKIKLRKKNSHNQRENYLK